ncbi:FAD-binding oxidoreductase [Synechococcus sp. Tobar12-5m-g]|uniref:FAD-dependent oxidoreductase n=2 Tax=unclassified Synechococcus TaxID=2626047 RepID=UPI0020CD0179|nr:FAD-binding oxidoreductase [Synechococcus sp. Cruz CV-v-12]MCP9771580.1 FAD-binding oxidoreductase [Synechococcus sp. Tobar12-5m-g]MCP9872520.1 FAD-binding oxidoreductase [Synechococcus sp. Cruz CV-v-12]
MNLTCPSGTCTLTGWGRTMPVKATVWRPASLEQLQQLVYQARQGSLIARGLGRSYGDAAQCAEGNVIDLGGFDRIELDPVQGTVTAGGGVSLASVLRVIVPAGFFLPVTPGTRNVTVGGAIAADVHGKNHHVEGSFASHVRQLQLVDGNGEMRTLQPDGEAEAADAFWATAGGMGLTGAITEATFTLLPIRTSLISVDTDRHGTLDSLMAAMVEGDARYRYSVAWVDSLHPRGRGVLTRGDHTSLEQLQEQASAQMADPLAYDPRALASAPAFLPGGLLNTWTVRAFNETWFRKAPAHRIGELQAIGPFFHPLDGVADWNRIYGPAGFLQYQFAVPDEAAELVPRVLEALRGIGAPSFLTVLKRFGSANAGPLSFPGPGWTLAADVPAAVPGLFELLDRLDEQVAASGGRLYLAKDSRQSAAMFQRSYPGLDDWRRQRTRLDPRSVFSSDLARRIGL